MTEWHSSKQERNQKQLEEEIGKAPTLSEICKFEMRSGSHSIQFLSSGGAAKEMNMANGGEQESKKTIRSNSVGD